MAITTADKMIEDLRSTNLLSAAQLAELEGPARPTDSRDLAKELVKREWLTRFQANIVYWDRTKELFLGPYVLLDKLGEGGMGEVYRARHLRLERVVALKLIRTGKIKNKDAISRFAREARAAAQLSHPNIVTLFDDGQEGDIHFLAMEFVKGVDLSRWVREKGPMPLTHACNFIRQAAQGLQHAHERGMVHRDIKPSNLMLVAGANQVKVLDMGLARLDRADDEDAGSITREGTVMGTPDFLAPEQAMNAHRVDIRADIYALGCSLYYLLTGQPPFPGNIISEKLVKHQLEEPQPVRELRPETPEGLARVLARMMAKKPENRYQTPAEAAAALAPYCRGGSQALRGSASAASSAAVGEPDDPTLTPDESMDAVLITHLRTPVPSTRPGSSVTKAPRGRSTVVPVRRKAVGCLGWAFGAFMALIALAAAVVLAIVFLNFLSGDQSEDPSIGTASSAPARANNLDDLRIEATAADERLGWMRDEIVGVLGTHRWRHWAPVKGLAFKKDGSELASFGDDDLLRFCNARTGAERLHLSTGSSNTNQLVRDVAYSPDGKYLAALVNGEVTVYWSATGRDKNAHLPAAAFAFSGDSKLLALAGGGGVNLLVKESTDEGAAWKPRDTLKHAGPVTALAFQPGTNILATFTPAEPKKAGPAEIRIWDLTKEAVPAQAKLSFPVTPHNSRTLLFSKDGAFLVTAAIEAVAGKWPVYLWDVKTKKEMSQITEAHGNRIWTTALTGDGKTLITGSWDGSVRWWKIATRELLFKWDDGGPIHTLALAPDDSTLAVGGVDQAARDSSFRGGVIRLFDVATGKEKEDSARAFAGWIRAAALAHDRALFAVALQDKTIKLVEAARLRERSLLKGHSLPALALDFTSDDRTLFSGSLDKTVGVWNVSRGTEMQQPFLGLSSVLALALSPDGHQLASGYQLGGAPPTAPIKLWDPIGRKELPALLGHSNSVTALDFFHESKNARLLSGSRDGTVRVWDTGKAKELFTIHGAHPAGVSAVAVSPKDTVIASAGEDGTLKIWEAHPGKSEHEPLKMWKNTLQIGPALAPYRAVAFSPDGKQLAVACQRGSLTLYDTGTWKEVRQWRWAGGIQQLFFDSAGKHLVSVNSNGTAYVLRLPLYR